MADGNLYSVEQFGAGLESFRHIRALGQRGVWMVKHPIRSESMDVVDFDREIEAREDAGLTPGVDFWTGELSEVES